MSYTEIPDPQPVAVKRMGKYVMLTQVTLRDQPDVLILDDKLARKLIEQLQSMVENAD